MTIRNLGKAFGLGTLAVSMVFATAAALPQRATADYRDNDLVNGYYNDFLNSYNNYDYNSTYQNRRTYDRRSDYDSNTYGNGYGRSYGNRDYYDSRDYNGHGRFGSYYDRYGYLIINGNYVDCNGNIDNDPAHHTIDRHDTDPAHHVGQYCSAHRYGTSRNNRYDNRYRWSR